jgi:hypothetical protein
MTSVKLSALLSVMVAAALLIYSSYDFHLLRSCF